MIERKIPELRFDGFDGNWEEKKLGEIVTQNMKPIPTPKKDYERLGVRSFAKGTFHEWVEARNALDVDTMYVVEANNLITNITFAWELAITVTDETDEGKIVSHRFPQFKFNNGYYPIYFKYAILDAEFRKALILASPGGAGRNRVLGIKEFLDIPRIVAKDINEQKIIGLFFKNLDQQILLTQEKFEKTKTLKNAMLHKMFAQKGSRIPEIRLEGFSGDWEEKPLNNYLYVSTETNNEGKYGKNEVLSVSGDFGVINQIEFQGRSFAGASVSNYGVVQTGDIVYTKSPLRWQPYGIIKTNKGVPGIVSVLYGVYHPKENIYPNFVQNYFESDNRLNEYLRVLVNKGAKNTLLISDEDTLNGQVVFPSIEEQKAISCFLDNLSEMIMTESKKLELLKKLKKSLLEKMFV